MVDKKYDADVAQFCSVTGASTRDARDFLKHHKRLDIAIDAYYSNPTAYSSRRKADALSVVQLGELFDQYKDKDSDEITIDGTFSFCEALEVDPGDVVLLAIAYELKSPRMGHWTRQGWIEGWKHIGADSISSMHLSLSRLRSQLASDPEFFRKVYIYTFDFARSEGQRSLGLEAAQAFWDLLLPHGFEGGALTGRSEEDGKGWQEPYNRWWTDFLSQKGVKGVSKDTWVMFLDFVRAIDAKFLNYDIEAAWPSIIDDFVDYARARLASDSS
jgi:DCN1-like protein 1/2